MFVLFLLLYFFDAPAYSNARALSEKTIQDIKKNPEKVREALYGDGNDKNDVADLYQKVAHFVRNNPVPTMGSGNKNIYIFVSPYCPHCQDMIQHIRKMVSDQKKRELCRFHILWISDKSDKDGRRACGYLMQVHQKDVTGKLCEEMMEKLNSLGKIDFKNFQTENNVSSEGIHRHDALLDSINTFVNTLNIEGLPVMFFGKKSVLGCPEKFEDFCRELEEMTSE